MITGEPILFLNKKQKKIEKQLFRSWSNPILFNNVEEFCFPSSSFCPTMLTQLFMYYISVLGTKKTSGTNAIITPHSSS